MWLVAVSVPLIPVVVVAFSRYGGLFTAVCHGALAALAWTHRVLLRRKVCVRSTHAYVFSNCTHGKADSVLETFDLYGNTHPSLSISPQMSAVLDEAVKRVRPSLVLELGMHCGYSSVRLLRLLPPAGRLVTVEVDPVTAELGEEILLVAGFKHSQFQVLTSSSARAIPTLRPHVGADEEASEGFGLVLMDHDPQQYLSDLIALEREELLSPSGCAILLINRTKRHSDVRDVVAHVSRRSDLYSVTSEHCFMMEIVYFKKPTNVF